MRILELNIIEFGCIKSRKISLDKGMNIIFGENESGKSTVMLFIKFMLYGLPKRNARGTGRERALSWNGRVAAGTMTVEKNGKDYLIQRRAGITAKSESLSITDLATGESVGGEPGELFLGVPAEVFESSCNISQMKAADISKSGAASTIENMIVSSDESIDVERIVKKLDDVRKEYKLNRGEGGVLYDTKLKIETLKQKQRDTTEKYLTLNERSNKLEQSQKRLDRLDAECERSEKLLRELRYVDLLRRFDRLEESEQEAERLSEELNILEKSAPAEKELLTETHVAELKGSYLAYREAIKKANARRSQYDTMPRMSDADSVLADIGEQAQNCGGKSAVISAIRDLNNTAKIKRTVAIVSLVLGVVCIAVGAVMFKILLALISLCAVGVILATMGIAMLSASKKAIKQRDAECGKYGTDFDGLEVHLDKCAELTRQREVADRERDGAKIRLDSALEDREAAEEKLVALLQRTVRVTDRSHDSLRAMTDTESEKIMAFCKKKKALTAEINLLNGRISGFKDELSRYDRATLLNSVTVDMNTVTAEDIANAEKADRFNRSARAAAEKEVWELKDSIATLSAGISQSPLELADRICELEETLQRNTEYYDALMLAKESIESASLSMSGNVTPALCKTAGELMSSVIGERETVQTTKSLELSVERDGFPVSSELLSGGTRDVAYICLRVALMMRLFENDLPPLLLDDSLCQLDNGRAKGVLSTLSRLRPSPQCLLFTCHERETAMCRELGIEHNEITL